MFEDYFMQSKKIRTIKINTQIMKKFTYLLITLLFSVIGYSQFPTPGTEGFENTTGPILPIPVASSPWNLGTGVTPSNQWAVFDNGVPAPSASQKRWTFTTTSAYAGTQSAFMNRKQNGGAGVLSDDYLATPLITVPSNGQLTFWTRIGINAPAINVNFLIKINTNTAVGSQTNKDNYTITAQSWDQTNIADPTNINTWVQKTVDLSAYAGQSVYIAFVRSFNQPAAAISGNSWFVDEVKLVEQCNAATTQGPVTTTTTSATLSWLPAISASWEIETVPTVGGVTTGVGVVYNGAPPYTITQTSTGTPLLPGTGYVFYIRKRCTESNSTWLGPYNFNTVQAGLTCAGPIVINSLPYSVTDTTANYADTYDVIQPAACVAGTTNYMTGNDVFYSYTAATTGAISIAMTPTGTNSSIFVYQGCSNVGVSCLAGVANTTNGVRTIPSLNVTAGQTYTIVLSSNATTQTYPYSLLIQQLNCPAPTGLGATTTATTATLNWTTPATTSWEYFVQNLNDPIPTTSGTTSTSNTASTSTLNSGTALVPGTDYQYWVRADCGNGTFSPWTGPYPFRMAPGCGGLFVDAGGSTGNYANSTTAASVGGTTTICPSNVGDQVTVTFTSFSTELTNDVLKVYNGSGTFGQLLASYSGTYTTANLPTITSSAADGCLTFIFTSNATNNSTGWVANVTCAPAPDCQQPILLTHGAVTYNSVSLSWSQPNNSSGNQPGSWDIIAVPCGGPAPTTATTGYSSTFNSTLPLTYVYNTALLPLTCYDFYVRASCSLTSVSSWSGPVSATTVAAPPICGGNFIDSGGTTGNYSSNENISTQILPVNAGDQVTVTFSSFSTQAGVDLLKVYDGTNTTATGTLLATYSGTYTGAALPSITSSSPDGILTFVFTSNATVNAAGWTASVSCAPAPACQKPILLIENTAGTAYNQVGLSWSQTQNPDASFPNQWQVIALPTGSAAPTDLTLLTDGYQTNNNINFIYPGLNPLKCYDFYVRSLCSGTSLWCGPTKICTPIAPPICGGNFVDSGGVGGSYSSNENITTTITTTPGNQVKVNFTLLNTQVGVDLLKVYDGTSALGTLLATYSGVYTGTALPSITSSSPDGALTFVFTSNGSVNSTGWLADIVCNPAPACQKPILLTAPPATIAYNQVGLTWAQTQNPDGSTPNQWQVVAVPCGGTAPTVSTPLTDGQTTPSTTTPPQLTDPGLSTTACYDFYVRAICDPLTSSTSAWTGPTSVTTALGCGGIYTDAGGSTGNYPNNVTAATGTTIITTTPGTQVTVTFTSFNTESGIDLLKVYDGSDPTTGILLGTYSGTAIPGPITSSAANGALSFVFTSNATTPSAGWTANVTCNPAPACQKPILLTTTAVLAHSVTLAWSQTQNPDGVSTPNQWEVYAVPCGSVLPANTIPVGIGQLTPILTTPQPQITYTYTGLTAEMCYDFYVRAICSSTSTSAWTGVATATTAIACPKPTGVYATSTSISTATVSWTPGGTETQWQILYLPSGSAAPGANSPLWLLPAPTVTTTSVNTNSPITGLSVGQFYDVYVRALCSAPDVSVATPATSLYIYPPLPNCAGVDLHLTTTTPGVYNLCPGSCLNLAATYESTFTTSDYTVSSTPFAPVFPFTGGTQVSVNTDDIWSGDIALPFKFCFYGNTYDKLNIGSNGVVTFNTHTSGSNCPWAFTATIPSPTFPVLNAIYAPYQDINPGPGGVSTPAPQPNINYQVLGTAPCRAMVISFSQVGLFSTSCVANPPQTSQVVLYETSNVIDVNIGNRNGCTTWNSGSGVIGVQNSDGSSAVVPPGRNTGPWSATNEAWRFLPAGPTNATFSWLQDGVTLTTNTNTTICPTVNTTLTAEAKYTACDGTVVTKAESILLNIVGEVTPTFAQIGPICQNTTAPILPLSSNNTPTAITGTWSPSTIDTSVTGTLTYTFTPDAGQCALPTTMNITVTNSITPTFTTPAPICSGTPAPVLSTTSSNFPTPITGVWTPATVSNTTSGTYTFQPNAGQCASNTTLDVTVNTNCSFGSYASAVWLTNCSTSNFFNTVGSGADIIGPVGNVFQNSDLGTYVQNSNLLILRGAEVKTFKSATANACSARLNYRIYPTATTPGSFQVMDLPLFDSCTGGTFPSGGSCNTGDQKWHRVVADGTTNPYSPVNLTTYLPGNYIIQVYYDITGSTSNTAGCEENILIDNNGAYFTANFTIQAQPTYSSSNPTTCSGTNGSITISGMAPSTTYGVSYQQGSTVVGPINLTSDNSGVIVINGLNAATYSNFTITVNGCTYPYTTPIILVDPVTPSVTVNNSSVCAGQSATVTATPGTAGTYSYAWTIPAGATPPGNVATFTTTIQGVYSVIITNTTTACSSFSGSGTVTVNTLPTVTVNSPTVCQGQIATVTASPLPAGNYSYVWTYPVGATDPGNVSSFNATVSGNYSVNATNITTGCSSSNVSSNVTINPVPIVSVNNPTVCGGLATVTATVSTPGVYTYTWTVPAGMTNPGNVSSFTTSVPGVYTVVVNNISSLCNMDFDAPIGVPTGGSLFVNQSNFSCWRTTASDGMIEVWSSGNESTPSYSGTQFIELNANLVSTLYQDMTVLPGSTINISFAHRGRFSGTDVMRVEVGPIGGPYVSLGLFSATPAAWVYSTVPYTFPNNGVSNYSLRFVSVSAGTSNLSVGNFIDAISVTTANCPATASGTVTINSIITPTFNAIAPICSGTTAPILPTVSTNTPTTVTGTWSPSVISNTSSGAYVFTPDAGQCSQSYTINVTVNSIPTPTVSILTQPTCANPTGTVEVTSPVSSIGTTTPTDLFISEVTDSNTGSLTYIEIFNGTGTTKNLADYSIKTANNGNAYTSTLVLNNINLVSGSNYVVAVGTGGTFCSTPGGDGSLAAQNVGSSGSVNFAAGGNDHFGLFNGTTQIDSWGTFGNADWAPAFIGTSGADFRRKNTISPLPNTTYNDNDWDILDYAGISGDCANNDYSNIGFYSMSTSTVTYQYSVDGGPYQTSPVLTGLTPGPVVHTITVKDTVTGCTSSITVTLDALPTAPIITGTLSACIGNTTQLSANGTPATTNAWTSSNTAVATIDSTGLVTAVANGTSIITYTNSDGCQNTATVIINALPTITGTLTACVGSTTQLSGSASPATINPWTSSNTAVATISASGLVTAVASGTSTITYTNSNGCQITAIVTINDLPTIGGTLSACVGNTTQLIGSVSPATTNAWTSSNTSVATISGSGLVTGVASGTSTITYTNSNGCQITANVTINALPTISGNLSICIGNTTQLTGNSIPLPAITNAWTSSNTAVATISTSGLVTAVAIGTSTITYTNSNGCQTTAIVTINALPTISGTLSVCVGSTTQLTGTFSPATINPWTSSNTAVATISTTGLVTGVSAGTTTITYTNSNGCQITDTVTVKGLPTVTVNNSSVCAGQSATVTATPGTTGTYSYAWTIPAGASPPGNVATFTTSISGTYSVIVTDTSTGCSSVSQSGVATIAPAFDFTLTDGCFNNVYNVNVVPLNNSFDVNTSTYTWQVGGVTVPGEVNATFDVTHYVSTTTPTPALPLVITSTVTSAQSCTVSHPPITIDRIYCEIQRGISPNNDNLNDYFDLRMMNVQQLQIFNRYGTIVYSKVDYSNEWIGQSDAGNELPDGTYYYVIEFKNNQPSKTGWIYINRETK